MSSSPYWCGVDIYLPVDVKSCCFASTVGFVLRMVRSSRVKKKKLNHLNADSSVRNTSKHDIHTAIV